MGYTVYVDEIASYVASFHEHAIELASPYVGLGRNVEIRHQEVEMPPVVWRYDYGAYDWVKVSEPSGSRSGNARAMKRRRSEAARGSE